MHELRRGLCTSFVMFESMCFGTTSPVRMITKDAKRVARIISATGQRTEDRRSGTEVRIRESLSSRFNSRPEERLASCRVCLTSGR